MNQRSEVYGQLKRVLLAIALVGVLAITAIVRPSIPLDSGSVLGSEIAKNVEVSSESIQADVADDMVEWLKKVLGG